MCVTSILCHFLRLVLGRTVLAEPVPLLRLQGYDTPTNQGQARQREGVPNLSLISTPWARRSDSQKRTLSKLRVPL